MTDNKKSKLIILTAGGTGGHVYPAEALAQELSQRGYRLMLITDKRGQNNYHGKLGEIENRAVLSGALVGKGKWFKIKSLIKTSLGILQSMWIIARRRPHCIVGFGGYASFPCSMAAILLGKNLILHEQNSVMSRTNRFLAKYATAVATSFSKTKYAPSGRRVTQTGMPVRSSISDLFTQQYTPSTGNRIFNLIILGGSQGAKVFGDVVPAAVKMLDNKTQKRLRITQQCRADDVKSTHQGISSFPAPEHQVSVKLPLSVFLRFLFLCRLPPTIIKPQMLQSSKLIAAGLFFHKKNLHLKNWHQHSII